MEFVAPGAEPVAGEGTLNNSFDGSTFLEAAFAAVDIVAQVRGTQGVVNVTAGQTEGSCRSTLEIRGDLLQKFDRKTKDWGCLGLRCKVMTCKILIVV